MIRSKENIYSWIGRSFALLAFSFLVLLSNHDSNSGADNQTISVDQAAQVVDFDHAATLVKPVILPDFDDSFESGISYSFASWKIKSDLALSNKVVNQQFKTAELRFYAFKPNLLWLKLSGIQFTSTEDDALIS